VLQHQLRFFLACCASATEPALSAFANSLLRFLLVSGRRLKPDPCLVLICGGDPGPDCTFHTGFCPQANGPLPPFSLADEFPDTFSPPSHPCVAFFYTAREDHWLASLYCANAPYAEDIAKACWPGPCLPLFPAATFEGSLGAFSLFGPYARRRLGSLIIRPPVGCLRLHPYG